MYVVVVNLYVDHALGFNKVWNITSVLTPRKFPEVESTGIHSTNGKLHSRYWRV